MAKKPIPMGIVRTCPRFDGEISIIIGYGYGYGEY